DSVSATFDPPVVVAGIPVKVTPASIKDGAPMAGRVPAPWRTSIAQGTVELDSNGNYPLQPLVASFFPAQGVVNPSITVRDGIIAAAATCTVTGSSLITANQPD